MKTSRNLLIIFTALLLSACVIKTVYYFPQITGGVSDSGVPLPNATIIYIAKNDNGGKWVKETTTDSNGKFTLETDKLWGLFGPHIHLVSIEVLLKHNNEVYVGISGKRDYMDFSPLPILDFNCDISNQESEFELLTLNGNRYNFPEEEKSFKYTGICAPNNMIKEKDV